MKTKDFLKQHNACIDGANWALSIGEEMDTVWESLIKEEKYDWLIWTATRPGVFPDSVLRKLACRFVRETPWPDGRKVWDLLTDERSRKAVEVADAYADGKATDEELYAAWTAAADAAEAAYTDAADVATDVARDVDVADAAADVAYAAADVAYAAARAAAYAADYAAAARDAAHAAQVRMIAEMGNPFKEREEK